MVDKYRVSKAFYFIGYVTNNRKLYSVLKKAGYTLIFKPTVKLDNDQIKGNVDTELVLHASAIEYLNYDKAIVVSGDGDFHCLYEFLITRKKLMKIVIPNKYKYSSLLKKFIPYLDFLTLSQDKLKK